MTFKHLKYALSCCTTAAAWSLIFFVWLVLCFWDKSGLTGAPEIFIYLGANSCFWLQQGTQAICVEIICWKMLSSRSSSCWETPPDCYPENKIVEHLDKDNIFEQFSARIVEINPPPLPRVQKFAGFWKASFKVVHTCGSSGVSRIFWISFVHSALSASVSAENWNQNLIMIFDITMRCRRIDQHASFSV